MSLTEGRNTTEVANDGKTLVLPVAAGKKIFEGSLVVIDADGMAQPATKAENLKAVGRCETYVDNSDGNDGDVTVVVRRGVFIWDNDADNSVTAAHVLGDAYILDDCTVTSASTGSSKAGKVLGVTDDGVIVETR